MADIQAIANDLSNLTVLQVAELVKTLEEKWGVSAAAAAPVMVAAAGAPAAGAAAAAEARPVDVDWDGVEHAFATQSGVPAPVSAPKEKRRGVTAASSSIR